MSPILPKMVVRVGAMLLLLWALSFGLSYLSLGRAALPVALAVAVVKAALVILFFMELLRESVSMKLAFLSATVLLVILIGLVIADLELRESPPLAPMSTAPSDG